jgi:hypothetical protein
VNAPVETARKHHFIAALGTRHRTEAPPFKRSSCREQDREDNGLVDALGTTFIHREERKDREETQQASVRPADE